METLKASSDPSLSSPLCALRDRTISLEPTWLNFVNPVILFQETWMPPALCLVQATRTLPWWREISP